MPKNLMLWALIVGFSFSASAQEKPPRPPLEQGEWITLSGADGDLTAIFTPPASPSQHGVVILVPDLDGHPNQPSVTGPLRTLLPQFGWATLSLPAPPADKPGGLLDIGTRRLQAAIDHAGKQKLGTVVLAGHGLGATLAAAYLANQSRSPVAGLIAIGWYDPAVADGKLKATEAIAASRIPVYDLYGSRDLPAVEQGAHDRLQAARKADRSYRQLRIEGADHDHTGLGQELAQHVRGWLHTTFVKPKSKP